MNHCNAYAHSLPYDHHTEDDSSDTASSRGSLGECETKEAKGGDSSEEDEEPNDARVSFVLNARWRTAHFLDSADPTSTACGFPYKPVVHRLVPDTLSYRFGAGAAASTSVHVAEESWRVCNHRECRTAAEVA